MLDISTIKTIYRARRYSLNYDSLTWYEPCPVTKMTEKKVTVISLDMPHTSMYAGGTFTLNREKLETQGHHHHTRHGEVFYVAQPNQGALAPTLDIVSAPDPLMEEAKALGWDTVDKAPYEFNYWQRECLLACRFAKQDGKNLTLQQAVDMWKSGEIVPLGSASDDAKRKKAREVKRQQAIAKLKLPGLKIPHSMWKK